MCLCMYVYTKSRGMQYIYTYVGGAEALGAWSSRGWQGGCHALRGGEQRGKELSFCRKCKSQIVLVAYLMRVYEQGGVLTALHLIASAQ